MGGNTQLKNNFSKAYSSLGMSSVNDLSKLGISTVRLTLVSDLDHKLDKEIITSLAEQTGVEGRKASFLNTSLVTKVKTELSSKPMS